MKKNYLALFTLFIISCNDTSSFDYPIRFGEGFSNEKLLIYQNNILVVDTTLFTNRLKHRAGWVYLKVNKNESIKMLIHKDTFCFTANRDEYMSVFNGIKIVCIPRYVKKDSFKVLPRF
jgi:hypothetical protein